MNESRNIIFNGSKRLLSKLQLLSVFFEDELIFKIYLRTQVIHKLFESNPELNVYKLELFHLQFTQSIIDLLKRVKTSNEKTVIQINDEIDVNEELIQQLAESMHLEESFSNAKEGHTAAINKALEKLYLNLSDFSKADPFPKNIKEFSDKYKNDFFYEVSPQVIGNLIDHNPDKLYKNGYGAIEKKLMGLQCKHLFKNNFNFGLKANGEAVEVYRLNDFIEEDDDHEYFVFHPDKKLFTGVSKEKIDEIKISDNISKRAKIILELTEKNVQLKNSSPIVKTNLPVEVVQLLTDYHQRIQAINFLDLINEFDIQANILKTMLNTDSI